MNTIIDKSRAYNIINLSMRKRTLLGQEYQKSQLNGTIGDILLYNTSKDDMLFVHADDYTLTSYPRNSYTPIGVCAVSADYSLDGLDHVCSLVFMSASNPTRGTNVDNDDSLILFGPSGVTYTETYDQYAFPLTYEKGGTHNDYESIIGYEEWSENFYPYLDNMFNPFQKEFSVTTTTYSYAFNSNRVIGDNRSPVLPSCDKEDGSINNIFRTTKSGKINPLTNFDGRNYSDLALQARGSKNYSTWKPTNTISFLTDYPCVSLCDMFYTVGTSQKQWYLPSIGELYIMFQFIFNINNAFQKVIDNGFSSVTQTYYRPLTSSTEAKESMKFYCCIQHLASSFKNNINTAYNCRAFLTI